MSKYIDADRLKAEIERLRGIGGIVPFDNREQKTGYESALIDIEFFLETLESEKPLGLEEEIKRYYDDMEGDCRYAQTARHFAQWGAEHKKIEPPCHTVDEWIEHIQNADQLTKDIFSKGPYDVLYDALNHPYQHCYDAIKEFGELCYQTARQDMMKGAVEHYVVGEIAGSPVGPAIVHYDDNLNIGDKVRIIIVKEEEK